VIIGIMYGVFSAIHHRPHILAGTYYLGRATANFAGINIYTYYIIHFAQIF
jgi:hypothetical protein